MTTRLLLIIATWLAFSSCSERDTTGLDDTGKATSEDVSTDETSETDVTSETDTAEDTAIDTALPDMDEGPKELVNGVTVRFGHIVDGDTVDVLVGNVFPERYTVRMLGLAAPECYKEAVNGRFQCGSDDEFYGLASREALFAMLNGKSGTLTCDGVAVGAWCPQDDFDRYLAYFEVDGLDIATEMARGGHALSYTSFEASKRADICLAEYEAQDAGRGMWAAGSVNTVINMMHQQTQNWYFSHHDDRCDAAIAAQ